MRKLITAALAAALLVVPAGSALARKPPPPPPPTTATVTIDKNSYSVTEGKTFVVRVNRNTSTGSTTVHLKTSDGTATSPDDYTPIDMDVTIGSGATSQTVNIPTVNDSADEANENFSIVLSANTVTCGCQLGSKWVSATLTISDNDPAAKVAISDAPTVTEGGNLVYTLTKTGTTNLPSSVNYALSGTSTAGQDYPLIEASGQVGFAPLETVKSITIHTIDDVVNENQETANVTLSNPQNISILDGLGLGKIDDGGVNADPAPVASIGSSGTDWEGATFSYPVSLDVPSGKTVLVTVSTYDVSGAWAVPPGDFLHKTTVFTFPAGTTGPQYFTVPSIDDAVVEPNENLWIQIDSVTNATYNFLYPYAYGTIKDNEPGAVALSLSNPTPTTGAAVATVTNTSGDVLPGPFTVRFEKTQSGTYCFFICLGIPTPYGPSVSDLGFEVAGTPTCALLGCAAFDNTGDGVSAGGIANPSELTGQATMTWTPLDLSGAAFLDVVAATDSVVACVTTAIAAVPVCGTATPVSAPQTLNFAFDYGP